METEAQLNNFYNDIFTGYCNLLSRQKKNAFSLIAFFWKFFVVWGIILLKNFSPISKMYFLMAPYYGTLFITISSEIHFIHVGIHFIVEVKVKEVLSLCFLFPILQSKRLQKIPSRPIIFFSVIKLVFFNTNFRPSPSADFPVLSFPNSPWQYMT